MLRTLKKTCPYSICSDLSIHNSAMQRIKTIQRIREDMEQMNIKKSIQKRKNNLMFICFKQRNSFFSKRSFQMSKHTQNHSMGFYLNNNNYSIQQAQTSNANPNKIASIKSSRCSLLYKIVSSAL